MHVETINPVSVKSPRMLFAVTCESLNDDDDGDLIVLCAFHVNLYLSGVVHKSLLINKLHAQISLRRKGGDKNIF